MVVDNFVCYITVGLAASKESLFPIELRQGKYTRSSYRMTFPVSWRNLWRYLSRCCDKYTRNVFFFCFYSFSFRAEHGLILKQRCHPIFPALTRQQIKERFLTKCKGLYNKTQHEKSQKEKKITICSHNYLALFLQWCTLSFIPTFSPCAFFSSSFSSCPRSLGSLSR